MAQAGFPILTEHCGLHLHFEQKVTQMRGDLEKGSDPMGIARKARNFLRIWLIEHIRHEDKEYVVQVKNILNRQQSWIDSTLRRIFGSDKSKADYQNNQA